MVSNKKEVEIKGFIKKWTDIYISMRENKIIYSYTESKWLKTEIKPIIDMRK